MSNHKQINRYSIKDLENITGIKAHTIRMWEKRYNIISPSRTKTNIRYYSDEDLKKLMNISTLNKIGIKISDIVLMSSKEICDKIIELNSTNGVIISQINELIISAIEFNETLFNKIISNSIIKIGIDKTYLTVIFPFLEKIGVLWQAGAVNPIQEHFISNIIKQKLLVAIDNLEEPINETETFILFLPDNELHEILLLFYYYKLKKSGYKVIYLGQSVPLDDLSSIAATQLAKYLLVVFTSGQTSLKLNQYLSKLSKLFSEKTIFISGLQVKEKNIEASSNIIPISTYDEILKKIK
ncbi:MAG: MerR family transcriptional regulator [Bacteroidota bacterium]